MKRLRALKTSLERLLSIQKTPRAPVLLREGCDSHLTRQQVQQFIDPSV